MSDWTADITNDPRHDYRLVIELSEGKEHRATVEHDSSNRLVLTIHPSRTAFAIPLDWLLDILTRARTDLQMPDVPVDE
jgi:hypothetical protein